MKPPASLRRQSKSPNIHYQTNQNNIQNLHNHQRANTNKFRRFSINQPNVLNNLYGSENKFWEYAYKSYYIEKLEQFLSMYESIQKYSKNKCMLQGIDSNLQFKGMDGTFHKDGDENQTVFIMMFAYHDIEENMGGEFYHEPSGTWTTSPTAKIPFKQGRVIEMTASDSHRADAFNVCYIPRFSIKFTGLNDEISRIYNRKNI